MRYRRTSVPLLLLPVLAHAQSSYWNESGPDRADYDEAAFAASCATQLASAGGIAA
jgi:hypothetical protein